MASLLIDFNRIIKPNKLENLLKRVTIPPVSHTSIGLVLIVSQEEYNELKSLPKGDTRVLYINSNSFVNSIIGHAWFVYDEEKKICEIIGAEGFVLSNVLKNTLFSIPNDVTLCVRIGLNNKKLSKILKEYIEYSFHDPYISKTSPMGFIFYDYGICLFRKNTIIDIDATNDVKYVLSHLKKEKKGFCKVKVRLSNKAIKYLEQISKMGSTINENGIITQKEVAGRLITKKVTNDLIYCLDVDKSSIICGEEEGVDVIGGLYNFHSHPKEAYERNNVKFGWPSAQDYVGFLSSTVKYDTILHIVATLEGFYVISLYPDTKAFFDTDTVTFILKKYDLRCKKSPKHTPSWYISTINNIHYKDKPIFIVQHLSWNKSKECFSVSYLRSGVNCIARESLEAKK